MTYGLFVDEEFAWVVGEDAGECAYEALSHLHTSEVIWDDLLSFVSDRQSELVLLMVDHAMDLDINCSIDFLIDEWCDHVYSVAEASGRHTYSGTHFSIRPAEWSFAADCWVVKRETEFGTDFEEDGE